MKVTIRNVINLIVVLVLLQATVFSVTAAGQYPNRPTPGATVPDTSGQPASPRTFGPDSGARAIGLAQKLSKDLIGPLDATPVTVSIRGTMPSLSDKTKSLDAAGRKAYVVQVSAFQTELEKGIVANGGKVIYRYRTLSSGVIAEVPGNQIEKVAGLPGVGHVAKILNFEQDLSETVPFIGGTALQTMGINGQGVKVAVLDSGIDFTHMAFGGYADPYYWELAYYGTDPTCVTGTESTCANAKPVDPSFSNLFGPSAVKVMGGFDWVGASWPNGPLAPDSNPIAKAVGGFHGTHVADIIAGFGYLAGTYIPFGGGAPVAYAGKGVGMAPGADLYAFTVCSQVTSSCSGVAMLQGLDSSADLDNDPSTLDPADVVNMSLGSDYGQPEDDAIFLSNQLTLLGTVVVAAAGNAADNPYIVSSPSIASGAISVAQTTVPSAKQYRVILNTPLAIKGDLDMPYLLDWSAIYYTTPIIADVVYDNTNASTRIGCSDANGTNPAAWTPGRFTGKIVLINRGTCSASLKVANANAAGASAVLISMIAAGPGYPFAYGGGTLNIPAFSITQADGNKMKNAYATQPLPVGILTLANATMDPANFLSLANTIVSTSSRGPRNNDGKIKPDIGAPGASVSAEAGTGAGSTSFGGTSGATPMVAGSIALLKDLFNDQQNFVNPQLTVPQYKALLMNSANNQIFENLTTSNPTGDLLPITRIGAGQVDLVSALNTKIIAWDVTDADPLEWTGSMSFQYVAAADTVHITRTLRLMNMENFDREVRFDPQFRYASDDNGAVTVAPAVDSVVIPAQSTYDLEVTITVDPSLLTPWFDWNTWWLVDRGGLGNNGAAFKLAEYDGYLTIDEIVGTSTVHTINVPWQIVPKPAADVTFSASTDTLVLDNSSPAVTSHTDLFNLVDVNPNDYDYTVGDCASAGMLPGCNNTPIDIKEVGYRMWQSSATSFYVDFGITLWDNPYRASEYPVLFDIYIDTVHQDPVSLLYVAGADGIPDFEVLNADPFDVGASTALGSQNMVWVFNLNTGAGSAYFYTDSTFDSNNFILTVPASAIGLQLVQTVNPVNSKMNFFVNALDEYFTGKVWDSSPQIETYHTVDVLHDRWHLDLLDQNNTIDPSSSLEVPFTLGTPADWVASGSQIGFLAMYREAPIQKESAHVVLGSKVTNLIFLPSIQSQ